MDRTRQIMRRMLCENEDPLLKELASRGLRRSEPVGKSIGGSVYAHKNYEGHVVPADVLREAKAVLRGADVQHLRKYNAVKYDTSSGTVTFQESPDFDEADEPIVGKSVRVGKDGSVAVTEVKADPQIWHHKWMWVDDDYQGFDVRASKERSLLWTDEVDAGEKSRIGTKSFWDKIRGRWDESWGMYSAAVLLLELRGQLTPDEVAATVATCRTGHKGSSWGDKSKLHKHLRGNFGRDVGRILDFGSGNPPTHGQALRKSGYDVTFHDHGDNFDPNVHDANALNQQYDVVLASKVLNVQPNPEALQATISQMAGCVKPNGVLLANYPEPHKVAGKNGPLSIEDIQKAIQRAIPSVDRTGDIFVCRKS
jgi:hypothetical protein